MTGAFTQLTCLWLGDTLGIRKPCRQESRNGFWIGKAIAMFNSGDSVELEQLEPIAGSWKRMGNANRRPGRKKAMKKHPGFGELDTVERALSRYDARRVAWGTARVP